MISEGSHICRKLSTGAGTEDRVSSSGLRTGTGTAIEIAVTVWLITRWAVYTWLKHALIKRPWLGLGSQYLAAV